MKNGAKVISRFSISSKTESKNQFLKLSESLPICHEKLLFKGERKKLTTGKFGPVRKDSSIEFKKDFKNIYNIEDCNSIFMEYWKKHTVNIKKLIKKYDIELFLHYEITIYDSCYPSFYFYNEFIKYLESINCNLTFYFYED